MKMKQNGFGITGVLVLLLLVAVVGAAGWYVANQDDETTSSNSEATQNNDTTKTEVAEKKSAYTLPDGWSEMNCDSIDSKMMLAYPDDDKAVDCDDRSNSMLIYTRAEPADETIACLIEAEIENIEKSKPISDYTCEELDINGDKVVKSTGDYGGGLNLTYEFKNNSGKGVTYYAGVGGELKYADTIDAFVRTFNF